MTGLRAVATRLAGRLRTWRADLANLGKQRLHLPERAQVGRFDAMIADPAGLLHRWRIRLLGPRQSLGIDISDDHVAAVVVEQRRGACTLVDWRRFPCSGAMDEVLGEVCEALAWKEGAVVYGLPLDRIAVRNLALPFQERRRLLQVLPFELEEQLIDSLDELVHDACIGGRFESGTLMLALAVGRDTLAEALAEAQGQGLDPDVVLPGLMPLAVNAAKVVKAAGTSNLLVVFMGEQGGSMALVLAGKTVLVRRLIYPDRHTAGTDPEDAAALGQHCARVLDQTLAYFSLEHGVQAVPERLVLTGPLSETAGLVEAFSAESGLAVSRLDLLEQSGVACTPEQRAAWSPGALDRALALALHGWDEPLVNFRRQGFAKKRGLPTRRKLIVAAAAGLALLAVFSLWLGGGIYRLHQQSQSLDQEMTAIYKQTFPDAGQIRDPYMEMRARLKALQGGETPLPVLAGEQRTLVLLADISRRLPASLPLKVSRLSIDQSGLVMKGETDTYNGVETIKSLLAASPRFQEVRIVSATAGAEGGKEGMIRFELQMRLGEW